MINTIIWDWNGTLLNDTDICLDAMNHLLKRRNKKVLTKDQYRNIFTFPVKNYYSKAGIDFTAESFDTIAIEFMELYWKKLPEADIFKGSTEVLEIFRQNGFTQILISAMEHESLINSVKGKGLFDFFHHISGIQDHFANGKLENAANIVESLNIDRSATLLIGDTIHDFEVAKALRTQCLLVADGHQSIERLAGNGCKVVKKIEEVTEVLSISMKNKIIPKTI